MGSSENSFRNSHENDFSLKKTVGIQIISRWKIFLQEILQKLLKELLQDSFIWKCLPYFLWNSSKIFNMKYFKSNITKKSLDISPSIFPGIVPIASFNAASEFVQAVLQKKIPGNLPEVSFRIHSGISSEINSLIPEVILENPHFLKGPSLENLNNILK